MINFFPKSVLLIIAGIFLVSCRTIYNSNNTYIGEYYNENYRYTLPLIIEFKQANTVQVTKILNEGLKIDNYILKQDSIIGLKRFKYSFEGAGTLVLSNDKEKFYLKKKIPDGSQKIQLTGKVYEFNKNDSDSDFNIIEKWLFSNDSLTIYRDYYYLNKICYSEVEGESYHLLEYSDGSLFIVFNGQKVIGKIFSINSTKKEEVNFFDYNRGINLLGEKTHEKRKVKGTFFVAEKQHIYQYYQFKKKPIPINGYNQLRRNIVENFNSTYIAEDDGFITIRFVINQQGEIGRFKLEQMNKSYQPTNYSFNIISNILTEVMKNKWSPAQIENQVYDCFCFLIFKIEKNKLIDVYI